jgi:hypothetical protein
MPIRQHTLCNFEGSAKRRGAWRPWLRVGGISYLAFMAVAAASCTSTLQMEPSPVAASPFPTEAPPLPSATPAPTQTPTISSQPRAPTLDPTLAGIPTARFAPTRTPRPTPIPPSTPTLAVSSGLALDAAYTYIDSQGIMHILGNVSNATEDVLEVAVAAILYDDEDRALGQVSGLTALEVIAPEATSPFEILVTPPERFAEFEVIIEGFDSDRQPRLDLEIEVSSLDVGSDYRLRGIISNSGESLSEYAQILVTLYDAEDRVIGIGMDFIQPDQLRPGDSTQFEIIVDNPPAEVERYQISAVAF